MSEKMFVHAVGGVIFNSQGKILIAKRPLDKYLGGLWEIPGGKIEQDETSFQALARELKEEVAIVVADAKFWFVAEHSYSDRLVKLDVWQVHNFVGEPYGVEGQDIRWIEIQEFSQYPVPTGTQEIISRLLKDTIC